MKPTKPDPTPPKRKPLSEERKRNMLLTLLCNAKAASKVLGPLTVERVAAWHPGYALAWRVARDYLQDKGRLPPRTIARSQLADLVSEAEENLEPEEASEARLLLREAYRRREELAHAEAEVWAVQTATRFLEEAVYADMREAINQGNRVPADVGDLLDQWKQQVAAATATAQAEAGRLFAPGWDQHVGVKRSTTGVPILDRAIGGGHAPAWVCSFTAPTGFGKTAMATAVNAELAAAIDADPARRQETAVIFSFETPLEEYRIRFLSHAAQIPKRRLEETPIAQLRGLGTKPLEYERKRFRTLLAGGGTLPSERERVAKAVALLDKYVTFYDLSRMEENTNAGVTTSVGMLANCLARLVEQGRKPAVVWIDHVTAMVDDIIERTPYGMGDPKSARIAIMRHLPKKLRDQLGKPFLVPIWTLVQLSGEANKRGATARVHHTDVEGCKLFNVYCDYAVVTAGHTDKNLSVWHTSKHRHSEPPPDLICRYDGDYSHFKDVSDSYQVDVVARQIVPSGQSSTPQGIRLSPPGIRSGFDLGD